MTEPNHDERACTENDAPKNAPDPAPVTESIGAKEASVGELTHEENQSDGLRTKKLLFGVLAAALVLAVITAAVFIIYFSTRGPKYEPHEIVLFNQGLMPAAKQSGDDLLWGYIDEDGDWAIEPTFAAAGSFSSNGLAPARDKATNKWGFIDRNGKFAIEAKYENADSFYNTKFAAVKINGAWGYINAEGKQVINPQFDEAYAFSANGLARVAIGGQYGYINRTGVYVITPRYDAAEDFDKKGYAAVREFGRWGLIDKNGDYRVNPQFDGIEPFADNGLARVRLGDKYGFINRAGAYVVEAVYDDADSFADNGLAMVKKDGKCGYINKKGEVVIPLEYADADAFTDDGLAAVKTTEGKWGYINRKGEFVLAATYDAAGMFRFGIAGVKEGETWRYIDKTGKTLFDLPTGTVLVSPYLADKHAFVIVDESGLGIQPICYIYSTKGPVGTSAYDAIAPGLN